MKILKSKIGSSAMALAMIASFALPTISSSYKTYADGTESSAWEQPEYDANVKYEDGQLVDKRENNTTEVEINKLTGVTFNGPWKHTGGKLSQDGRMIEVVARDAKGYILLEDGNQAKDKNDKPTMDEGKLKPNQKLGKETIKTYNRGLGRKVVPVAGVQFSYFKITYDQLKYLNDLENKPKDEAAVKDALKKFNSKLPIPNPVVFGNTNENPDGLTNKEGKISVPALEDGCYWFIETKKPSLISSSLAIPFGLSLPLTNIKVGANNEAENTKFLKKVILYPKNVGGNLPDIEKDVEEVGNDKANYTEGEEFPWIISTKMPDNIYDYENFVIEDKLDIRLNYIPGSTKVYLTDKKTLAEIEEENKLVGTDIVSIKAPEAADRELKVSVKNFEKLGEEVGDKENLRLYVVFKTTINETAEMGTPIPNEAKLDYDNQHNDEVENLPDEDKPKTDVNTVETGGKQFFKYENKEAKENEKGLPGAVFELIDGNENIKWNETLLKANEDAIKAGKFVTKPIIGSKYEPITDIKKVNDTTSIYLKSSEDGSFGIKGLQYTYYVLDDPNGALTKSNISDEDWANILTEANIKPENIDPETGKITEKKTIIDDKGNINYQDVYLHKHDYKLKEVKAPEGFALRNDKIEFKITNISHSKAEDDAKIENRKITIPQTGGMGSILYILAGAAAIGGAIYLKKKEKNNK